MRKAQSGQLEPVRVLPYSSSPQKRSREDSLPLREASSTANGPAVHAAPSVYPEPYPIRKYQPSTPLSVTAAAMANAQVPARQPGEADVLAETAESRPAIPLPGPGAVMPASKTSVSNDLSHIPTQVVGVNGDPYLTRVLPPMAASVPGDQLPLPDPNTPISAATPNPRNPVKNSALAARKGGSLLHTNESPVESENTATGGRTLSDSALEHGRSGAVDKSFVF